MIVVRDDNFYLFALFKALVLKFIKRKIFCSKDNIFDSFLIVKD